MGVSKINENLLLFKYSMMQAGLSIDIQPQFNEPFKHSHIRVFPVSNEKKTHQNEFQRNHSLI